MAFLNYITASRPAFGQAPGFVLKSRRMSSPAAPKHERYLPLLALLLAGLLLRLPSPVGLSTYQSDELRRDLAVERQIAAGHPAPTGPVSKFGGFHFGPAYYYLYFPFAAAFGFAPYSMAAGSAFFSLAAVAAAWYAAGRWFRDRRTAWLAAVMLTLSALDIQFAKYASNPNPLPLFALLFFIFLEKFMSGRASRSDALGLGLTFAVATQLHAVALIGLPAVMIVLAAARRLKFDRVRFAVFAASVLAVYAPFIYHEAASGFPDIAGLAAIAAGGSAGIINGTLPIRLAGTGSFWVSLVVRLSQLYSEDPASALRAMMILYANVIAVFLIWVIERPVAAGPKAAAGAPSRVTALLAAWIAVPSMLLLLPVGQVDILPIYYFTLLEPAAYLLIALGLVKLWRARYRWLAGSIFVSWFAWQVFQIWDYHRLYPSVLSLWLGRIV